jgi:hypothetical protein
MVIMEQFQIGFCLRSKMQIMIVELQATVSFLFYTTKTFMPIISEELKDLPMPPNNENLELMHNKDIIPVVQTYH